MSFHPFAAPAAFAPVPAGAVGFAEPDWKGDADFDGLSEAIDLDGWLSDLADEIADGARRGWLTAYQARRAGFDLQSIRCQLRFERMKAAPEALRAILSRIDRLSRCVRSVRLPGGVR